MKIIKQIAKQISKSNKIVLFHHVRPDGDCLSSSYGLMKALQLKFPNKEIKWYADKESIEKRFSHIVENFDDVITEVDSSWTAIVGDVAVSERVFGFEEYEKAGIKICFDHHQNTINFEHDLYWSQPDLGASSVQAFMIAKELKVPFNSHAAKGVLFGILTDTYNFFYSLADHRPLDAASDLMKYISNDEMDEMYRPMRTRTQKDINFMAFALSNYKTKNGVAHLKITAADQKKLKMDVDEVSRVNVIGNIEGIGIWALFVEDKKENSIKTSLRSIGAPVNEVASKFGGGGHIRASGIKLDLDWKLMDEVIKEAEKKLKTFERK